MNNNANNNNNNRSIITNEQKWTAVGLLGAIGSAFYLNNRVKPGYILTSAIGFGLGTASSVGFYRVADLMKNGTVQRNQFGRGALAGSALFCALMSVNIIPLVVSELPKTDLFKETNQSVILPLLLLWTLVGFFQNRANTLETIADEPDDANKLLIK